MSNSHAFNEKSSFESERSKGHILVQEKHSTTKTRHIMFRVYPYFMAARNERRSSNGGFLAGFFGFFLGRPKAA